MCEREKDIIGKTYKLTLHFQKWAKNLYIVACHLPGAPSYGGVRTWVEGSQMRGDNVEYTLDTILIIIEKLTGWVATI